LAGSGSVQFVELFTKGAGEVATQTGLLSSDANDVGLVGPVDAPTTQKSFLIATPGFADLEGAVTPDTVMPGAPFFSVSGDTLIFQTLNPTGPVFDTIAFSAGELPLDGVQSLHRENPGGTPAADPPGGLFSAENSPTNYSGDSGHLMLPEPHPALLAAAALLAVAAITRARQPALLLSRPPAASVSPADGSPSCPPSRSERPLARDHSP
jgi:hypothetical protein